MEVDSGRGETKKRKHYKVKRKYDYIDSLKKIYGVVRVHVTYILNAAELIEVDMGSDNDCILTIKIQYKGTYMNDILEIQMIDVPVHHSCIKQHTLM